MGKCSGIGLGDQKGWQGQDGLISVSERIVFFDIPGEDRRHLFSKAKNKDNRLASGRQHYFAMLIGHSSKENVLIWLLQLKENNVQKFVGSHSVGFLFILFLLDPWISFIKIQILQRRNIFEKFLWLKMLGNCMQRRRQDQNLVVAVIYGVWFHFFPLNYS